MSAKKRLLSYLSNGRDITVNQARSRFGVQNISQRVHELRQEGVSIYSNRVSINGNPVVVYRLGTPSKAFKRDFRRGYTKNAAKRLYSGVRAA